MLAGDIVEGHERFRDCLAIFRGLPGEVTALAGNHDVWARQRRSSQELWERALPDATRGASMLWLEDVVWRRDGLAVAALSLGMIALPPRLGWTETVQRRRSASFLLREWLFLVPLLNRVSYDN